MSLAVSGRQALIYPQRNVTVRWANPMTRGLRGLWLGSTPWAGNFAQSGDEMARSAVNGFRINTPFGLGRAAGNNDDYGWRAAATSTRIRTQPPLTVLYDGYIYAAPTDSDNGRLFAFEYDNIGSAPYIGVGLIRFANGNIAGAFNRTGTYNTIPAGGTPTSTGQRIRIAYRLSRPFCTLHINGVLIATFNDDNPSRAVINYGASPPLLIGAYYYAGGYRTFSGCALLQGALFDRLLSDDEIFSWTEDPTQLFRSRADRTRRSAVAPVVTEAYPVADITAGGWTPSAGSDLFAMLTDEPGAGDTTYIRSPATAGPNACEIRMSPMTPPGSRSVQFRIRHRLTP